MLTVTIVLALLTLLVATDPNPDDADPPAQPNIIPWKTKRPVACLTPCGYYLDYPGIDGAHSLNYGLKGNYWLSRHWALAATYYADDNQNTGYALGLNFRF